MELLDFDSNLFGFHVGRLILQDDTSESIGDELQQAYSSKDIKLVYIICPTLENTRSFSTELSTHKSIPGYKVDVKTTYTARLSSFDKHKLVSLAYMGSIARAVAHKPCSENSISPILRDLAISSGEWSRFRIDSGVPRIAFEKMFETWLINSLSRSIADEVFLAIDVATGAEIGFITVKLQPATNEVNIGLLSVLQTHRRMGVGSMLLSRAVLWAIEQIGGGAPDSFMSIVTQGANATACRTYDNFGFKVTSTQDIYHAWLPQHLFEPSSLVADQGRIPYCRQFLTGNEMKYLSQLFESGRLDSAGRYNTMCADKIHNLLGGIKNTDKVLIVPSGTAALEMAAMMCDLHVGDEVILPSYTFSSTANAFALQGAALVFVDIRRDTLCIDETLIERAITPKTKAICCVHYAGISCEMDVICDIAARHNLFVIEDAAQAFLSEYKGRPLGSIGHFGCFSFHFTKNINCGEGGALAINKGNVQNDFVSKALIIWEKGTNRYDFMAGKVDKYEWIDVGSSYVPSEVTCAVLWAQLEKCEEITARRIRNFEIYHEAFAQFLPDFMMPRIPSYVKGNAHIFFIILDSLEHRSLVASALKACGISGMSHYVPLHSAPAGLKFGRIGDGSDMSVTNSVFEGLLRLPVWVGMRTDELDSVVACVRDAL